MYRWENVLVLIWEDGKAKMLKRQAIAVSRCWYTTLPLLSPGRGLFAPTASNYHLPPSTSSLLPFGSIGESATVVGLYLRPQKKFSGFQLIGGTRYFCSSGSSASSSDPFLGKSLAYVALIVGSGLATYYYFPRPAKVDQKVGSDEHVVTNWSGTHVARTKVCIQPESLEELEAVVVDANSKRQKLRPVGSGLSPNGIGLSDDGMVNLALMDKILNIDKQTNQVTVQAGARVEQVVDALRPHGLTLQNFASIKEQQIGGFTQVGAHGTGATLPPVDEQVVSLRLVTPGKGTLDLSANNDPELFYLSRCSLGLLGVVAEVTLQCVPIQKLLEYTFVTNKNEVQKRHKKWLQENKHLRYLWIPDTDAVVVVQCNPLPNGKEPPKLGRKYSLDKRLEPFRSLYKELSTKYRTAKEGDVQETEKSVSSVTVKAGSMSSSAARGEEPVGILSDSELSELSFSELRDRLLDFDPLNREHVKRVNEAEAEYWKRSEGYRVGWSDDILGFECGGQQWVAEVCFPTGTLKIPNLTDLDYPKKVLELIRREEIPAPAPIEQRWTASSRSPFSPAFSSSAETLFSWVTSICAALLVAV
eukprot:c27407_g1_i2 orf=207-1967(-)